MPFDDKYFSTHTYAGISFGKFSQYWWSNRFYARLARRYGKKESRLLEIGSGLGHLVGQLSDHFKTFGLDVNLWALLQSQAVAEKTYLQVGSAVDLPYADASFGLVVIKHVVEHLDHPGKCIQELGRILAPGGVLILATPNLDSLLKPLKGDAWIGFQDPTHIALKPPKEWLSLIKAANLSIERVFADGFWDIPYISWIPNSIQKLFFGSLGGFQAISGLVFLPYRWGESIIVIARRK
ncbi:MAG: class I SAM-dependent methyltransferase [Chloroflexota bacterium]